MRRPELIFDEALIAFLKTEGNSLLSNVSERNTCSRLSLFIERQLEKEAVEGYYADVEYNRKQRGKVKTIINNNLAVVSITVFSLHLAMETFVARPEYRRNDKAMTYVFSQL